jgi:hypothetical protein
MTWVIGAISIFGYGIVVSDVQVSWKHSGKELPILRKAYPVGNTIVAGFAGSVRIGFRLIDSLRVGLAGTAANQAWHPWWVAKHWPPEASRIFDSSEPEERALKSEVLLVGVSPTEQRQHDPKVYLIRMSSPDFRPRFRTKPLTVWSIGSGTGATRYMTELAAALDLHSDIILLEQAPGGWAAGIARAMDGAIIQQPMNGVGEHLQIHIARREGITIGNNDERKIDSAGNESFRKIPSLADSWFSFERLAASKGMAAARASC